MWLEIFLRGIVIGLVASLMSVGPVGVLVIQRTLSKSHRSGLVSGFGVACGDTFYAMITFFSLSVIMNFLEQNMMWFKIIGGICIIAVGANIFFKNPIVQIRRNRAGKGSLWKDFLSIFLLTIAQPAMIFVFLLLFASFGLTSDMGDFNSAAMIVGVLGGAVGWWVLVTFLLSLFRKKIRPRHLLWMNRIAGALVVVLGLVAILSQFFSLPVDGILH